MNSASAILLAILAAVTTYSNVWAQTVATPPFQQEISAFLKEDREHGIKQCRTLFAGSSTIRLWRGLPRDVPRRNVIRRGFGGAHLSHVIGYYKQLIARYRPREIVLYAGENDIAAGRTPSEIVAQLNTLLKLKSRSLGNTPVYFIAIKPSLARWHQFALQTKANLLIEKLAATRNDLIFVDVVEAMLESGRPKPIFMSDGLHMNRNGYAIWARTIDAAFAHAGLPQAAYCRDKSD